LKSKLIKTPEVGSPTSSEVGLHNILFLNLIFAPLPSNKETPLPITKRGALA